MNNTPSTIHIAHRSTLLCEVLREALENRSYRVLGFSTTGADTLAKLNLYVPDILIISNVLEGISGIEIAERAQQKNNACIFMSDDAAEAQAVNHRLKVTAHLPTYVSMSELFYTIHEVANDRRYISPVIERYLSQPAHMAAVSADASVLQVLTTREIEIMQALAESYTTPQIAEKLFISHATVNNHRANIMQKLELKGRNQLMSVAIALRPFYKSAA
jgi:two-component system OmpR family response regulator